MIPSTETTQTGKPRHTYTYIFENGILPPVQTNTPFPVTQNKDFENALLTVDFSVRKLYRVRVDGRKRRFSNTMTSEACDTRESACAHTLERWKLTSSNRFRVFVWTGKYDSKMVSVEADFFIYISVFENILIRVTLVGPQCH